MFFLVSQAAPSIQRRILLTQMLCLTLLAFGASTLVFGQTIGSMSTTGAISLSSGGYLQAIFGDLNDPDPNYRGGYLCVGISSNLAYLIMTRTDAAEYSTSPMKFPTPALRVVLRRIDCRALDAIPPALGSATFPSSTDTVPIVPNFFSSTQQSIMIPRTTQKA